MTTFEICLLIFSFVLGIYNAIKNRSKSAILIIFITAVLLGGILLAREPQEAFSEAKGEAISGLLHISAGALHVIENPSLALLNAIEGGTHLSRSLDCLREAQAETRRRSDEGLSKRLSEFGEYVPGAVNDSSSSWGTYEARDQ